MSLIGDMVMSLPIVDHLKIKYPNSYFYFSIAKKCQQAKFMFENHPNINEIKITDHEEDLGPSDYDIIKNCDVVINPKPNHPKEQDWYNYRSCLEETFIMGGLNLNDLKTKPKLYLNNTIDKIKNSIAFWPVAGYGSGFNRSPSNRWWTSLLSNFPDSKIYQFGSEKDFKIELNNVENKTYKSFQEQIIESLKCSVIIGTDSGSMWVTGAYGLAPQINLITNWLPNHYNNLLALAPEGDKCFNFFGSLSCDNISISPVKEKIIDIIKNEKL